MPAGLDIDATILRVYARMMERFEAETAAWGEPDLVELSYEFLEREPIAALERIHAGLRLEGFDAALPAYRAHLDEVRGFRRNRLVGDGEAGDKVAARLGRWIAKWGYHSPAPARIGP